VINQGSAGLMQAIEEKSEIKVKDNEYEGVDHIPD
jgi:hypothetical protein